MSGRLWSRAEVVLVGALLISYTYFSQAGGWNQNSRFDLVRALVEQGTTRIDSFVDNTGDRALANGHAYSDKAPGQALTALPVASAWEAIAPRTPTSLALMAYAMTVWASGIPTVVAAASLGWSARVLGASRHGALVAALAFGLASPAWIYASLLWGHGLAGGCLALAFAAALALRNTRTSFRLSLVVGLAAGWAVVTEYPAAPAAAIVVALALYHGRQRVLAPLALGVALNVLVLAAYNVASFGSPLFVSYSGVQGFVGMSEGLFGVTSPKRTILQEILFGQFRGLLPLAPELVLAPIGLLVYWRMSPANRLAILAAAGIVVYYLLFNSAYYYWDGGFSYGPRHIGAALPLLFIGLAPLWRGAWRVLIALLVGVGAALSTMAISTIVLLPEDVSSPMRELILPAFLHGDLAQNRQSFLQYGTGTPAQGLLGAWNLGQLLGLPGVTSLLPLALIWVLAFVVLYRFRET